MSGIRVFGKIAWTGIPSWTDQYQVLPKLVLPRPADIEPQKWEAVTPPEKRNDGNIAIVLIEP